MLQGVFSLSVCRGYRRSSRTCPRLPAVSCSPRCWPRHGWSNTAHRQSRPLSEGCGLQQWNLHSSSSQNAASLLQLVIISQQMVCCWVGFFFFCVLPSLQWVGLSSAARSGNFPSRAVVAVKARLCPAASDKDGANAEGPSVVGQSDCHAAPFVKEIPFLLYFKQKRGSGRAEFPSYKAAKLPILLFFPWNLQSPPTLLHSCQKQPVPADECIPPDTFCLLYRYPGIVLFVFSPPQNAQENRSGEALLHERPQPGVSFAGCSRALSAVQLPGTRSNSPVSWDLTNHDNKDNIHNSS